MSEGLRVPGNSVGGECSLPCPPLARGKAELVIMWGRTPFTRARALGELLAVHSFFCPVEQTLLFNGPSGGLAFFPVSN